ncbi:putative ATP-dependent RNA helicase DHX35 [Clavelina lepadiformis]|uniref:RNA helicase n=1 Tax=Clavelina lepadiformis TaxID=159417 RepID=A0ABP0G060_CLALP
MAFPAKRSRFWKPGENVPVEEEIRDSGEFVHYSVLSLQRQQQKLPIYQYKTHILYLLEKYQTLIIVGETGSGKSTQIPQYLLEAGWAEKGKHGIVVTQPRRIAAVTLAQRVANEQNCVLGNEIGYAIRFDESCDSQKTLVKYVTEGVLLTEMMADPLLKKYNVVMVDEAHERNVNTDVCLGLLKKIQAKRPDLRIIVSSATLDAEKLIEYFSDVTSEQDNKVFALSVQGRHYPIEIFYTQSPVSDYVTATINSILQIHFTQEDGDILAFMTGQEEVNRVVSTVISKLKSLRDHKNKLYLQVLPLYSALPAAAQMLVFEPKPNRRTRRVVVATNIAETSVSIEGIVYVVDCGFVKLNVCDPKTGIQSLAIQPASQASLHQRAGRAGRFRNGKAYRLFTEKSFTALPKTTVPEMQRSELLSVILQLKALGVNNVAHFGFVSPPPAECMVRGLEQLYALGVLTDKGHLSRPLGQVMAEFPLNPMFAKMLLESEKFGCSEEIVTIAALLQIHKITLQPFNEKGKANLQHHKFSVTQGDLITLLNIYNSFVNEGNKTKRWCNNFYLNYHGLIQALKIRTQLCKYMAKFKIAMVSCNNDITKVLKCIVSGFFLNAAQLRGDGFYHGLYNKASLVIHPTSVLVRELPKWIVYTDILQSSKTFMRNVTAIEPEWLSDIASHVYTWQNKNLN